MDFAFQTIAGALDRQAHLREGALDALWPTARVMALWRGRIAIDGGNGLLWLSPTHPLLAKGGARAFLGQANGRNLFAMDVSEWQPTEGADDPASFFDQTVVPHPDMPQGAGFADLRAVMTGLTAVDGECAASAKALFGWHDSHGFCARCGQASVMTHAGWQRHCPACGATHFPRTDPVVIMLVTHGDRLLLGRSPAWPEGMYSLLAGFVEPGETFEAAVRREVFEETGVVVGDVRYLASQPWPFPASLMLGAIGQATSTAITLDPAELQDAIWLTRQEVLDVQLGHNPKVKPARKGAIAQYLITAWLSESLF